MREGPGSAPLEPMLRLAAATNLGIAGRTVRVDDGVEHAATLRRSLLAIGAIDAPGPVDYRFTEDVAAALATSTAPAERLAVVIECGSAATGGAAVRRGVVATDRHSVVVVTAQTPAQTAVDSGRPRRPRRGPRQRPRQRQRRP